MNFFNITLYYQQNGTKANGMHDILIETVRALKEMNFVADNEHTNSLCTTNLGEAAYKGLSFDDYNAVDNYVAYIFLSRKDLIFC